MRKGVEGGVVPTTQLVKLAVIRLYWTSHLTQFGDGGIGSELQLHGNDKTMTKMKHFPLKLTKTFMNDHIM